MPEPTLSKDTKISIALVLALSAPAAAVAWTISNLSHGVERNREGIERGLDDLQATVEELRLELKHAAEDRWRRTQMRQWAHILGLQNPDLKLPDLGSIE